MDPEQIKQLIEEGMPDAQAQVRSPDGTHFEAVVISRSFSDQPPLKRHRRVHEILGERLGGDIHALSLRTLTPEEAAGGR